MSDYISREAICLTDFEIAMCNGDYKELCKMILDKIANAPAADVRPVVLCRDCVHRHVRDWPSCQGRRGDFFCADGKKREEN